MDKRTEKILLWIILLVAIVLRFYNYWDFSLSNDELSAIARLKYDSFQDLIQNGVRIDGHPAAAQVVLYYFTRWFGNSVAIVRLPFVFTGIAAVYFVYRLGKEWISSSTGLLAATTFATLVFPLLYSRIARPYSFGMLFAVMAATYWIRIVKDKHRAIDLVWLVISLSLCAYTHYFCALVAAILAITGTFLIKGNSLRHYLLALVAAFILYLPYIPIFFHQLSLGGIGQWLSPPGNGWLLAHIFYAFNGSWFVLIAVLLASLIGWIKYRPQWNPGNVLLPIGLFISPFIIGFLYSIFLDPVLQHSTLLFSFPFLLIFLFAGWRDTKPRATLIATAILTVALLLSTLLEKQFYRTNYFGVFKELSEHIYDWTEASEDRPILIGDFNHPSYIHYYLDRQGTLAMDQYRTTDPDGLITLKQNMSSANSYELIYAWSTISQLPEVEWVIRDRFPEIKEQKAYFNSGATLFQKGGSIPFKRTNEFSFVKTERWNFNPEASVSDSLYGKGIRISLGSPYGPTFSIPVAALEAEQIETVTVKVYAVLDQKESSIQMVFDQQTDETGYAWESDHFNTQLLPDSMDWGVFHYAVKPSKDTNDVLKIFPWLPEGNDVLLLGMEVRLH